MLQEESCRLLPVIILPTLAVAASLFLTRRLNPGASRPLRNDSGAKWLGRESGLVGMQKFHPWSDNAPVWRIASLLSLSFRINAPQFPPIIAQMHVSQPPHFTAQFHQFHFVSSGFFHSLLDSH